MPFCKICFDLGRSGFDNHYVRDSARNTTCPYLLNTKCKNCQCFGHTVTYCNMPRRNMPRRNNNVLTKNPYVSHSQHFQMPSNVFNVMMKINLYVLTFHGAKVF